MCFGEYDQTCFSEDNKPTQSGLTKHMNLNFQLIRDHVWKSYVKPAYVLAQVIVADVMTKNRSKQTFDNYFELLGIGSALEC